MCIFMNSLLNTYIYLCESVSVDTFIRISCLDTQTNYHVVLTNYCHVIYADQLMNAIWKDAKWHNSPDFLSTTLRHSNKGSLLWCLTVLLDGGWSYEALRKLGEDSRKTSYLAASRREQYNSFHRWKCGEMLLPHPQSYGWYGSLHG